MAKTRVKTPWGPMKKLKANLTRKHNKAFPKPKKRK